MTTTPAVPDLPELPAGVQPGGVHRWRPWHVLTALGFALVLLTVLSALALGALALLGVGTDGPAANIAGIFMQDVAFVLAAVLAARTAGRVRPRDFGLVRPPRWAWWATPPLWLLFPVVTFVWVSIIGADPEQDQLPSELGVDDSTVALVLAALLICVGAPVVEELFFRGFMFPALRSVTGVWPAALVTGALFGLAHVLGSDPAYIVPLGLFGAGLCLLYRWTGSLYPGIGLHALNNSIAFSSLQGWDWQLVPLLAAVLGSIAVLGLLVSRLGGR